MNPKRRLFRLREDGALLVVLCLLVVTTFLFIGADLWWLAALTVGFSFLVATIWLRQVKARWCPDCDVPMQMRRVESGDRVIQLYHCETCLRGQRSGVDLEWSE